jgi:hypothetical protein
MTTINQAALGGQSQVAQTPAPVMSSAGNTNVAVKSDAQVVAAVVTTPIKPSGVLEASQPSREVVAKAAEQLQSFVQSMGRNLSSDMTRLEEEHTSSRRRERRRRRLTRKMGARHPSRSRAGTRRPSLTARPREGRPARCTPARAARR